MWLLGHIHKDHLYIQCIHTYIHTYIHAALQKLLTVVWLLQSQSLFNWWVLHNQRHCSWCMWTARLITSTTGYLLEVILSLWITCLVCISTSASTRTGNVTQSFFPTFCGVYDLKHSHSLSTFLWSGLSNQQMLLLTETVYTTRGEEWFLHQFVLTRWEWSSQCLPRLLYSQPPCAWHLMLKPAHLSLLHLFC